MRINIRQSLMGISSVPAIAPHTNMFADGIYTAQSPFLFSLYAPKQTLKLIDLGVVTLKSGMAYTLQFRTDGAIYEDGDAAGGKIHAVLCDEYNNAFVTLDRSNERHIFSNGANVWTFTYDDVKRTKIYFGIVNHDVGYTLPHIYHVWDIKLEEGGTPTHLAYLTGGAINKATLLVVLVLNKERRAA